MSVRLDVLVCAALASGCGNPHADEDDEVGVDASTSETSTSSTTDEGSTSSDTDTSDDATDDGPHCGTFHIGPDSRNLMLVVDASSSMILETWDHDDDPQTSEVTRWSSARMLVEVLEAELLGATKRGLQRFPAADADADVCLLAGQPEVELSYGQNQILAILPGADADAAEIVGGSPASAAVMAARDHLLEQSESTSNIIVLITDGGANCGAGLSLPEAFETYDETLATAVGDALQSNSIETFVVGVDVDMTATPAGEDSPEQVDAFAALQAVALAGGHPQLYDAREPQALLDAVANNFVEDTSCVIDLNTFPGAAPPPRWVWNMSVLLQNEELPHVEDCETEDGWTWIVEGDVLAVCGSSCEQLKDGAQIDGGWGNCFFGE